jgi:hypothetical protein
MNFGIGHILVLSMGVSLEGIADQETVIKNGVAVARLGKRRNRGSELASSPGALLLNRSTCLGSSVARAPAEFGASEHTPPPILILVCPKLNRI